MNSYDLISSIFKKRKLRSCILKSRSLILLFWEKKKNNHIHKETDNSNTRFAIHIEFLIFLWTWFSTERFRQFCCIWGQHKFWFRVKVFLWLLILRNELLLLLKLFHSFFYYYKQILNFFNFLNFSFICTL